MENKEGKIPLHIYRHSASHILAQAVKRLFPEAKLGIGPATENGFYYDFARSEPFTPQDLELIEKEMEKIIRENQIFKKREVPKKLAEKIFKDKDEPYKLKLLRDIIEDKVTLYQNDEFIDLCRGPHIGSTGEIKAFKLLSVAGAYWKGKEGNPMLQRIYGTAFQGKEELEKFLWNLEEAKKRDHRKLGKELQLFSVHPEVGPGLIHWHPRGAIIVKNIQDYWYQVHIKEGYEIVYTPHIASEEVYNISGHLENYLEMMYSPMEIEGRSYRIKPMNCPGHIMIYKTRIHSYRDLPVRLAEMGTVYRYERSGVLHGLLRVRGFTIDDAHIFCRPDQLEEEIKGVINLATHFLKDFGFDNFAIYLATKPEKSVGRGEDWDRATQVLKKALEDKGFDYQIDEGGGAFYGPKIDIKVKDVLDRSWQCTTIQFDFNLPERFQISYVDKDGLEKRPYMIHRAILGSMERFVGILIEHYGGDFPLWLAPVQVRVIPVSEKYLNYAEGIKELLEKAGIRCELDRRSEKVGFKVRDAEIGKIPYMVLVGKKEEERRTVSVRERKKGDLGSMKTEELVSLLQKKINEKG